jgi:DNA-binding transcriptional LysR family regulator
MTQAARRLHLLQSAVSQSVKRLEDEFGLELVERRSNGVRPTAAGEALAGHLLPLLASVDRLEATWERVASNREGS